MDYLAWNDALAGKFFNPEFKGRRIFLYVTASLLAELGGGNGGELDDFLRAVKDGPQWAYGGNVCEKALRCLFNWRRGGLEYPPYLGYLALFALAAGLDGDFAPNAYYPRLRKLLSEPPVVGPSSTYPRFAEMRRVWGDLELWSVRDKRGDLGFFQLSAPGRFVHVGVPISQVILTEQERSALPAVFADSGLAAVSNPSEPLMRQCLLRYGASRLRNRTLLALQDSFGKAGESELIISAALQELDEWDGTLAEQKECARQKRGSARICLTEIDDIGGRIKARIRCRLQGEFPEGLLELSDGNQVYQCEKEIDGWSTPLCRAESGAEFDAADLNWSEPFQLSEGGERLRFQMPASEARVFASGEEEDMNGYIEVQSLPREQKVFVLANESAVSEIEQWARHSCDGFRRVKVLRGLPIGWKMFAIERVQDDKWIRHKYSQFAFSHSTQVLTRGGIRDLSGAYFPFALPTIDIVGAPASARLLVNDNPVTLAACKDLQLDVTLVSNLEFRIEVQDRGSILRRRTLHIRAPEQFLGHSAHWVDKLGRESNESLEPRASGSRVVGQTLFPFDDWIEESSPSYEDDSGRYIPDKPNFANDDQGVSLQKALALLSDWRREIIAKVGTTFTSELAQLPGGRKLSEGAWQYKTAIASKNERNFPRAIIELSDATKSDHPVVRIAAFVLLHLISKRTDRPSPPPPEVPDFARNLVHRLARSKPELQIESPELQLSISDISPLDEDGSAESDT
jgi:hypothetical protein